MLHFRKENLEKFKEWLDSDRSKVVTFVEVPEIFGDSKVFLIPMGNKTIKLVYEGEKR